MEFKIAKDELMRGIATVERAARAKESMPELEGIQLTAEEGRLRLVATDLELAIKCYVSADVATPGQAVLNGKVFGQIVRKLGGEDVSFRTDAAGVAVIQSGKSKFTVHTMAHDQYPALPPVDDEAMLRVTQKQLREMVRRTIFATSVDDSRPFLTGVLVEVDQEEIRLVATDSSRLAFHRGRLLEPSEKSTSAIIPVRTLTEIMRLLGDTDAQVLFSLSPGQAVFQLDGVQVISRVIDGQFPDYARAMQGTQESKFVVDRHTLLAAVERVALIVTRSAPVIRFTLEGDLLSLSAREAEVGDAFEELEVESLGPDGAAAYQARFISEMLKAVDCEKVRVELGEGLRQGRLVGVGEDDYTYIVMPVRVG